MRRPKRDGSPMEQKLHRTNVTACWMIAVSIVLLVWMFVTFGI